MTLEDALDLLARWDERRTDLTTSRAAVSLQITTRRARDLLDELADRGVADRREPDTGGANFYWLADGYSADDVEAVIGDPEPEPDTDVRLKDALGD